MKIEMSKKNELSKAMMKLIIGGIDAKEYCDKLFDVVMNNYLDAGACEGANIGSANAGCGWELNCEGH